MDKDKRSEAALKEWSKHRDTYEKAYAEGKALRRSNFNKNCKECSAPIPFEKSANNFCNHTCSAHFNNRQNGLKRRKYVHCKGCSSEFIERPEQEYCTIKCSRKHREETYIKSWLSGNELGGINGSLNSYVRRWVKNKFNHRCMLCGWQEINPTTGKSPLNIDHIDGDSCNNSPDNLRLLCPNCHSLTPTYGSLNKGKGRPLRYKNKTKVH